MGWRYLFFTLASITLGVFVLRCFIFPFYESPKFLLSKGNDKDAIEVVRKIATFNKRSCHLTVESLYEQCKEVPVVEQTKFSKRLVSEISRVKLLFGSWRMARVTILVWITWMFDWWGKSIHPRPIPGFIVYFTGFSIAATYLPTILQRKNSAIHISVHQTYVDYLIGFTPGFGAVILSVLMVRAPMIGRKWTLVFSSMVMGIALFLYNLVNTEANHVGFNSLEYFGQTLFNSAVSTLLHPSLFCRPLKTTASYPRSSLGGLRKHSRQRSGGPQLVWPHLVVACLGFAVR